jgi:hypothetical protein
MEENRRQILNESSGIISKLQLLSAFFEDEVIYKIYVRSQVIHQLFMTNTDLDINRLSLFHLQFTETVIGLLRKVKQSNEQNVNILYEEIGQNRAMVEGLEGTLLSETAFNQDKQRQAQKMDISLRKLYQVLAEDAPDYPFSHNINAFSARYAQDFYPDITPDLFGELIQYNPSEVYSNTYAVIHRKLLGQLNKQGYRSEFHMGLKAGNQILETYKFADAETYYLYLSAGNLFLFFHPEKIQDLGLDNHSASKKARLIRELKDRNARLESNVSAAKTFLPAPLKALLAEYYRKISDINFLTQSDFEVQANILKTMLNTDSI